MKQATWVAIVAASLIALALGLWPGGRSRWSKGSGDNDTNVRATVGIRNIEWREATVVGTDGDGVTYAVQQQFDNLDDDTTNSTIWYRPVKSAGHGGMVDGAPAGDSGSLGVASGNAGWMLIGSLRRMSYNDALDAATGALNARGTTPPADVAGVMVGGSRDPTAIYTLSSGSVDVNTGGAYNDPYNNLQGSMVGGN